jgi:hypothetical protein
MRSRRRRQPPGPGCRASRPSFGAARGVHLLGQRTSISRRSLRSIPKVRATGSEMRCSLLKDRSSWQNQHPSAYPLVLALLASVSANAQRVALTWHIMSSQVAEPELVSRSLSRPGSQGSAWPWRSVVARLEQLQTSPKDRQGWPPATRREPDEGRECVEIPDLS